MKDNLVEIPYRKGTPRYYKKHWEITIEYITLGELELQDSEREVFQEWVEHLRHRQRRCSNNYDNIACRDILDVLDDVTMDELLWWSENYPSGFVKFHAWTMYQEEMSFIKSLG
jgi:hypothetical protein